MDCAEGGESAHHGNSFEYGKSAGGRSRPGGERGASMAGHDGRRRDLTRTRVLANGRCIMGIINSDNGDIVRVECR